MRMRGCPATGRMFHQFDKTTHRCKCGRWKAGHKPKTEPVRPRNECQICEREQALDTSGNLGHHGYKRPGCGWIQGDCMGVGHKPYPATDALELSSFRLPVTVAVHVDALINLMTYANSREDGMWAHQSETPSYDGIYGSANRTLRMILREELKNYLPPAKCGPASADIMGTLAGMFPYDAKDVVKVTQETINSFTVSKE